MDDDDGRRSVLKVSDCLREVRVLWELSHFLLEVRFLIEVGGLFTGASDTDVEMNFLE